jgi:DNA-binding protein H-NS
MKDTRFEAMPLDDLWRLHEEVMAMLSSKIETQKRELERKLARLGLRLGGSPDELPQRRPYPKVTPKFQNPAQPLETWSGRGRQPRWVSKLIEAGKTIEDFRI